jgi:hypothetical protein
VQIFTGPSISEILFRRGQYWFRQIMESIILYKINLICLLTHLVSTIWIFSTVKAPHL